MQQTVTHCRPYTKEGKEQSKESEWIATITSGLSGGIGGSILGSFAGLSGAAIGAILGFFVAGFSWRKAV